MNTTSEFSSALRRAVDKSSPGIVSFVDAVLNLCREHNLQLDWQVGRCLVRPPGGEWEEMADVPVRKSVFRAILARVAVVCCEKSPNTMSPYGGQARLTVGENPAVVFHVVMANTPANQRLQLLPESHTASLPGHDSASDNAAS